MASRPNPVFIVGTGRSGTHWLGEILRSHPGFRVTVEQFPMFQLVTRMAVYPPSRRRLLPLLVWIYRAHCRVSRPRVYADKSHPAIWIAEDLARAFPSALFLGMQRNPFGTVCSMLRHTGVQAWHERWRRYPVPNEFLGISREVAPRYDTLSPAARCALRWQSHREKMEHLTGTLGVRLHVVSYEDLVRRPERQLRALQEWLGLEIAFVAPTVARHAADRWQDELSDAETSEIAAEVGFGPDDVRG